MDSSPCRGGGRLESAIMKEMARRMFLLSSIAFPLGCTLDKNPHPSVRGPKTGQWGRYAKRDAFTGKLVDEEVARVTEDGDTITIERRREAPAELQSWGTKGLHPDR